MLCVGSEMSLLTVHDFPAIQDHARQGVVLYCTPSANHSLLPRAHARGTTLPQRSLSAQRAVEDMVRSNLSMDCAKFLSALARSHPDEDAGKPPPVPPTTAAEHLSEGRHQAKFHEVKFSARIRP